MLRDYVSGSKQDILYFVGDEVENTAVKGLKTLFVATQDYTIDDIKNKVEAYKCQHVYFGANKLYKHNDIDFNNLNFVCASLLADGIEVTIDFPSYKWESIMMQMHWVILENGRCHLNVSVELPNVTKVANVNIKVDDVDFNATNPGVWVIGLDRLDSIYGVFNDWIVYKTDKVVE